MCRGKGLRLLMRTDSYSDKTVVRIDKMAFDDGIEEEIKI